MSLRQETAVKSRPGGEQDVSTVAAVDVIVTPVTSSIGTDLDNETWKSGVDVQFTIADPKTVDKELYQKRGSMKFPVLSVYLFQGPFR